MKYKLLSVALVAITSFSFAQQKGSFWKLSTKENLTALDSRMQLPEKNLFDLDANALMTTLSNSPQRNAGVKSSSIVLSLPNAEGQMERFSVYENSIMDPALAAQYPEIKSYVGIGIDNPTSAAYFSFSPLGFKSMVLNADKPTVFIEPFSKDLKTYSVYTKLDKKAAPTPFECRVTNSVTPQVDGSTLRPNADDSILRTFRVAVSVTSEYTTYFGGTTALALAAINTTMTRVNGIFEKDFGVRMVLVANNNLVIYTNAATDPYSDPAVGAGGVYGVWADEVQATLTSVIGAKNYDVGHLFAASGSRGSACIGCVCSDDYKGSSYMSPFDGIPSGDFFDLYVAHEFGHEFGANHTFSMKNNGSGTSMEPGSGSTIMGYSGLGWAQNIQSGADAYFHAVSIQEVTDFIKTRTCQTNTATQNSVPTANAGLDYTIPKSTPFMLTGTGTDTNGDALTYNWEQFDNAAATDIEANSVASATRTTGPTFRSYIASTSPVRYFPKLTSVLAGLTTTTGSPIVVEALPSVARTMNFRLTVRDNRAGGSANNSDDMIVTVNGTAGPFSVTSPNTAVSYVAGSFQNVTWNVAGTTANGVNCAKVDIFISTNGGTTWSKIVEATPNDGSQPILIPNSPGTTNRIMVKGTNHIFFDVSNTNFTIIADTVAPTAPTLSASGTTSTTTNLYWTAATDNVGATGYNVYRGTTLLGSTTTARTYAVTGLTASTAYTFTVKAKDAAGNISVNSNVVSVTTTTATYCTSAGTNTDEERIGRVQVGTINNPSTGTAGYENFTAISTNLVRSTAYTITITPTWPASVYPEGYAVYIDYNRNGVFTDAGETVYTRTATSTSAVSGSFTVPATALLGATRMRVKMEYNATPTSSCGSFLYGQVEDYTVNITSSAARLAEASNNQISFNLYPNPVLGDVLNISNLELDSNYRIYNMMGQEVGKGKIENESIYVGLLATGTYLLEVSNAKGATSKRFIKQ